MKLDPLHEALIKLQAISSALASYQEGMTYTVSGTGLVQMRTMADEITRFIRSHECEPVPEETAKRKITIQEKEPEF